MTLPVVDAELVRRLIAEQFPRWSRLDVRPLAESGWNNHTLRLGDDLLVRLPRAEAYAPQVEAEQRWLPVLAPQLPLTIPQPVGKGEPGEGYPWPWTVARWIEGQTAIAADVAADGRFGADLAGFLLALQSLDASEGPAAGPRNFHRGGALATYDEQTRTAIARLEDRLDGAAATAVWEAALAARFDGPPVWVHGDVAPGNLLLREGRLCAVIDFGCMAVGDPACDLAIAWACLEGRGDRPFGQACRWMPGPGPGDEVGRCGRR